MTTPINFNSAYRCITMARQNAGKLQEGQEPSSETLATDMNRLSDMISLWQTQGLKLWTTLDLPVTFVANQPTYNGVALGTTRNLRVISAYQVDSTGNRTPLQNLSWDEYTRLSNTTQAGTPNSYFVDKQPTQLNVSFWLTPDTLAASTYTGHLVVQQQITTAVGLLDTLDFPQEWFIALQWGLAAEICTGQPDSIVQRCEGKAHEYRMMLENWDYEDSPTMFTPDQRSSYNTGNFR